MTTACDTSACPVLTGPNNFQIWKLRIISKLRRENSSPRILRSPGYLRMRRHMESSRTTSLMPS
ncbi:hypothetical protein SERLA73DRAFT_81296 [Serpula lacrymans var. lacrymans S7.3]|uniref:Uncharacterized protein n=1 Tax=Serpula lacrymans var. lacrymans (strain S7.3) TaxID=936435 RepID=F8QKW1_SERL3|nr:hypothetical protein SERLA73DRAFT_81296 [Serpula lacrymans var. lacrymans S7.3]